MVEFNEIESKVQKQSETKFKYVSKIIIVLVDRFVYYRKNYTRIYIFEFLQCTTELPRNKFKNNV